MDEFTLSTNDINRHGYRVLTEGIDLTNFLKNPVMYWEHEGYRKPIGKWINLRKEKGNLIGTPVFDENDDEAKTIKSKVEQGIVNATSIHCTPIELSSSSEHLLQGQQRETVTKCELLEVSFTGIPGNGKAVRLSAKNEEEFIPLLKNKSMKRIALKLGLNENSTEEQIMEAMSKMAEPSQTNIEVLLSLGRANGHVTDDNVEQFRALAKTGYDSVFALVNKPTVAATAVTDKTVADASKVEAPVTLSAVLDAVKGIKSGTDTTDLSNKENWDFDKWQREDSVGLLAMKRTNPEKYTTLALAYNPKK